MPTTSAAPTLKSSGRAPPSMADEPFRVREFRSADATALTAIIEESPEAAAWAPDALAKHAKTSATIFVGEFASRVTGFVIGRQISDEGEILNLAIRHAHRREGQASALLRAILDFFRRGGVTRVFLEVRESNLPAITFYQKHGFRETGRRRGYYRNPDEDALLFERKLTG